MGKLTRLFLSGMIVLAMISPGAGWASARTGTAALPATASPGVRLLSADSSGVTLELVVPEFTAAPAGNSVRLEAPGLVSAASPGEVELPVAYALLAVPPAGEVEVRLREADTRKVPEKLPLRRAPQPAPLESELQPGTWAPPGVFSPGEAPAAGLFGTVAPAAAPDNGAPAYFPARPVRIVEEAWLRSQRLVRVEFSPFQLDPAGGELVWHRRLLADVVFSGPASAGVSNTMQPDTDRSLDAVIAGMVLNPDQAPGFRAAGTAPALPQAQSASLGPRYRIAVDQDGVYRLTYADLAAAGVNLAGVDPRNFRLSSQGQDVAVHITGEADGKFDSGDALYFYGQRFRGDRMAARYAAEDDHWPKLSGWQPRLTPQMFEKYTDENVYWLLVDGPAGPRMPAVSGAPSGSAPVPAYYTATQRVEESHIWWSFHFTSEDTWFWNEAAVSISTPVTNIYTTTLSAVAGSAPGSATVSGEVVAFTGSPAINPDHHTRFEWNGVLVEDAFWDGKSARHLFQGEIPLADLNEGENTLTFTPLLVGSLVSDRIFFDFFQVDYPRQFVAVGDVLEFIHTASGAREYRVDGLDTPPAVVLDVSDPALPQWVNGVVSSQQGSSYRAAWEVVHTGPAVYAVAGSGGLRSPLSVSLYTPPDLYSTSNGADYLIITHADFLAGAQALADYRAAQGLRTRVIDVADLYAEFNDGIYHPLAIKTFLKYAHANWQAPAPLYVVLVGSGHWNFKNFTGLNRDYNGGPVYMPPHLVWVDYWQGEVDSSSLLANIVGDDILPDLHIARMPVSSAAELATVIQKTIAYESSAWDAWQDHLLFVADNVPDLAGDFVALSDSIINGHIPAGFQADRAYLNDFTCPPAENCPLVTQAITASMNNTGALFTNYIGHGAIPRWTGEGVFRSSILPAEVTDPTKNHIAALTNIDRLTVMLSMTCLDGYWLHATPDQYSLVEAMLAWPAGGAVGAFSPTGLGVATGHDVLNRAFFDAVFADGVWQLGPATLAAKLALFEAGYSYDLIDTFTIFGDPALHVKSPYALTAAARDPENGGPPGTEVPYKIEVTNLGTKPDSFALAAPDAVWTVTDPGVVGPLAPGEMAVVTVTVAIPPDAINGQSDAAVLQVTSLGDVLRRVDLTLNTLAQDYGVDLSTAVLSQAAPPGSQVVYPITVRNAGAYEDSYTLQVAVAGWQSQLSVPAVGPLAPGETAAVQLTVTIPSTAGGLSDQVEIQAVSQHQPAKTDSLALTTEAVLFNLYMPVLVK